MTLEHLDTLIAFAVVMLLLSLIVTTLVQMATTALGLRGRNLFWGVRRLLAQVDPTLAPHAKEIANSLLRHPAISHLARFRAVAIRKEEMIRLLGEMAKASPSSYDPWYRRVLRRIVSDRLRIWLSEYFPHPSRHLSADALKALTSLTGAPAPVAAAAEVGRIQALSAALGATIPRQSLAIQEVVDRLLNETHKLGVEVNAWFDTVMDRTSERFKYYARWITAILAFVLAAGFQINSFFILSQLSEDPQIRQSLVQISGDVQKEAENSANLEKKRQSLATTVLQEMKTNSKFKDKLATLTVPPGMDDQGEGEAWLQKDLPDSPEILDEFRQEYREATGQLLEEMSGVARNASKLLNKSGLRLSSGRPQSWKEVFGILATGIFLSLGAPFWFNTLRKLSDLRPIVARRVEGEAPKALR